MMRCIHCNFVQERNLFNRNLFLGFLKLPKTNIKSWSIVFFGSDNYSLVSLKGLHRLKEEKVLSNLEIVTNKGNPVYKYSVKNNFTVHSWLPNLDGSYDLGVIVSFGKLIPKSIIDRFPLGIINVHGSLLPKYRGGMPIPHALKNGDTSTGITVTRINPEKFDAGEIILQKSCLIGKNELLPSLYKRMADLGCESLLEIINSMPECLKNSFPQSEQEASYAPVIKKAAAVIRWNDMTSQEIFNLHRALFGIFNLESTWEGREVKFPCLSMNDDDLSSVTESGLEPGSFIFGKKRKFIYVQCKDKPIKVCSIIIKRELMNTAGFFNGYLQKVPRSLWKFKS